MANDTRPIPRGDEVLSRIVFGVAALAAGVIFWLDRLGTIEARDYFIFWPVILIAFGVTNVIRRHWIAAVILFVLGFSLMPAIPFLPHVRLSFLFAISPLLISVAGVALVLQAVRPATSAPTTFRAIAVMGGNQRMIGSSAPEETPHGEVIAVMGGCEIDLTRSNAREVVIDLLVFWGGVEIKVPRGWVVVTRNVMIVGALVNNTARPANRDDAPKVVLTGAVIMAGVEVKNPKEAIA